MWSDDDSVRVGLQHFRLLTEKAVKELWHFHFRVQSEGHGVTRTGDAVVAVDDVRFDRAVGQYTTIAITKEDIVTLNL